MKGYKVYKGYIYFYGTTYHKNSKATNVFAKKKTKTKYKRLS